MEILIQNLQDIHRSIYNGDTNTKPSGYSNGDTNREPSGYTGQYKMEMLIQNLQDTQVNIQWRY